MQDSLHSYTYRPHKIKTKALLFYVLVCITLNNWPPQSVKELSFLSVFGTLPAASTRTFVNWCIAQQCDTATRRLSTSSWSSSKWSVQVTTSLPTSWKILSSLWHVQKSRLVSTGECRWVCHNGSEYATTPEASGIRSSRREAQIWGQETLISFLDAYGGDMMHGVLYGRHDI